MGCKDEKSPRNEDVLCQNTEDPICTEDPETDEDDRNYSEEYKVILRLLKRCGRLAKSEPTRGAKSELDHTHQVYLHNTEKLLRCYRRFVWEIQSACFDCAEELQQPLEKVSEYLKSADTTDNDIIRRVAERNKSLANSKKMVDYLNVCLTRLKSMPAIPSRGSRKSLDGETLYRVLKLTYLFPDEIIQQNNGIPAKGKNDLFYSPRDYTLDDLIEEYGGSRRKYYTHRKAAIEELSLIMWGSNSEFVTTLSKILEKMDI